MAKKRFLEGCRYIVFKKGREKISKLIYEGTIEKDHLVTHRFIESFDQSSESEVLEIEDADVSGYVAERIIRP